MWGGAGQKEQGGNWARQAGRRPRGAAVDGALPPAAAPDAPGACPPSWLTPAAPLAAKLLQGLKPEPSALSEYEDKLVR